MDASSGGAAYAIRFTATELSRLAGLIDCRRRLIRSRDGDLSRT